MVPAMAVTGEVDGGAPVDRGEVRDGGVARPAMGCGAAGGKGTTCAGDGCAVGEGRGGAECGRWIRGDAPIAGHEYECGRARLLGLYARMGADACGQALAKKKYRHTTAQLS